MRALDLNVASPDDVPLVLSRAADAFSESSVDLQAAWQDPVSGRIWQDFAEILGRAAVQCEAALAKRFGMQNGRRACAEKDIQST